MPFALLAAILDAILNISAFPLFDFNNFSQYENLCYKLLFSKETFFESNRWFLLAGLISACILPLVVIPN